MKNPASLSFFPTPIDGESLYSVCARFDKTSGYNNGKLTSKMMLGHPRGGSRPDAVTGLNCLQARSNGTITAEADTLRNRTLLRAYLPFMSKREKAAVLSACTESGPAVARARIGITWMRGLSGHELRCCPSCIREQMELHGFSFWQIEHQYPGIWACRAHGSALHYAPRRGPNDGTWVRPTSTAVQELAHQITIHLPMLLNIASWMDWLCSFESIDGDVLAALVRSRLRSKDLTSSELVVTKSEVQRLLKSFVEPLVLAEVPHFGGLAKPQWVYETLNDGRANHPLKWATLFAMTGEPDFSKLHEAYRIERDRLPQPGLFPEAHRPRRVSAPDQLYQALTGPVSILDAAISSGLKSSEIQAWLRRDKALSAHWRQTGFRVKRRAARLAIEVAIKEQPLATRVAIIKRALWAVRWLQTNDPKLLDQLLPSPYGKQRTLPF